MLFSIPILHLPIFILKSLKECKLMSASFFFMAMAKSAIVTIWLSVASFSWKENMHIVCFIFLYLFLPFAKAEIWNSPLFTNAVVISNFMGVDMETEVFLDKAGSQQQIIVQYYKGPDKIQARQSSHIFFLQENDQTWRCIVWKYRNDSI